MGSHTVREDWVAGDPWCTCDRCGMKYRRSETRREWTGLRVCVKNCWESRHPQLSLKTKYDRQEVVDPRPEPPDQFLDPNRPYEVAFTPKVRVHVENNIPTVYSQDPLQYKGRKGDE